MKWFSRPLSRRHCDDLQEEMRLHIEERAEQLMGEGMSRAAAKRTARLSFGSTALVEERCLGEAHLLDGQPGGAGRGDRRSWDELQ